MTADLLDLGPRAAVLLDHARERVDADGAEAVLSDRVLDETCDRWWQGVGDTYAAEQNLVDAVDAQRRLRLGDHPADVLGDDAPRDRQAAQDLAEERVVAALRRLITGRAA